MLNFGSFKHLHLSQQGLAPQPASVLFRVWIKLFA